MKLQVTHAGCPEPFVTEPRDQLVPMTNEVEYSIEHSGIKPDLAADVVDQYREKFGKIQTNHPYVVKKIGPDGDIVDNTPKATKKDSLRVETGIEQLDLGSELNAKLVSQGLTTIESIRAYPDPLATIEGITTREANKINKALEEQSEQ